MSSATSFWYPYLIQIGKNNVNIRHKVSNSSNSNWHRASGFLTGFIVWRYSGIFSAISSTFYTVSIWINFKPIHFECYCKISFISIFRTTKIKMGNWKISSGSIRRWFKKLRWCWWCILFSWNCQISFIKGKFRFTKMDQKQRELAASH